MTNNLKQQLSESHLLVRRKPTSEHPADRHVPKVQAKLLYVWVDIDGCAFGHAECPDIDSLHTSALVLPDVDFSKCELFSDDDLRDVAHKYGSYTLMGTLAAGKVLIIQIGD